MAASIHVICFDALGGIQVQASAHEVTETASNWTQLGQGTIAWTFNGEMATPGVLRLLAGWLVSRAAELESIGQTSPIF